MAKQTSMATMVANLELRSTQYKREMAQAAARNKQLTREIKSTSAAGDVFGRSMRGAAQGVAAIDGPLGGVSGRVGALNGLLTSGASSWALFGAGVAGVTAVFYQSIRAGEEMERQQLKIEALLKATGSASGRTAQQLDDQARSVARATLASVTGIREAQGVLITFKGVQGPVFDDAIRLSQDLSAVMGGDAKSAALQLGKALEEPSTGLTALKRAGVSFTEQEKEQIKTLEQSGRVAEAQRMILLKLEQQVGGAGAAEAGGLTGATDSLGQAWQEFLEGLSETSGSTSIATAGIQKLTGVVDTLRRGLAPTEEEEQRNQFAKLHSQLVSHQHLMAKAEKEGVQVQFEIHKYKAEKILAQLDELQNAQIAAQKKRQEEERIAEEAAAAAREQAERDRIAQQRAMAEEAGGAQLIQLDQFLADQQGKIQLDHEQRLQQIAALQVAEEELTKRGFESIEALRAEYSEREKARYQMALAEEQSRSANDGGEGSQVGADGLTDAERQRITARLETLQLSWLTEMEQLQVQQDEEMALLDQAYAKKLINHDDYERKLTLLEGKHAKQREKLEQVSSKNRWKAFGGAMDMMLGISNTGSKKLFKIQKALSLAKAAATLPSAIIESYNNSGGYPWGIPAAVAMAAAGAAQIAQIKSASFDGGASASSVSTGGAVASTPSESFAASNDDGFVEGDSQQPGTVVNLTIQGDLIGDNAQTIADKLTTMFAEQDLVAIPEDSRQAQILRG
ncbi:phage tail length tape measure family protein [Microbulbifer variabilis]|uniref:Phage tail length tape measure family protein n=1 Tax=Microbulbifer variabilis TaxID=266805 RepID=A0ABY4VD31_9GAMM|nr:phage tail length tape measure family protein [Microbulbifer variabilis]USD22156.1 phage tail length tape measure family protein [Microbulbifer variabilis]